MKNHMALRVEEFVDRRSNRDDDWTGFRYRVGGAGENQSVVAERRRQQVLPRRTR